MKKCVTFLAVLLFLTIAAAYPARAVPLADAAPGARAVENGVVYVFTEVAGGRNDRSVAFTASFPKPVSYGEGMAIVGLPKVNCSPFVPETGEKKFTTFIVEAYYGPNGDGWHTASVTAYDKRSASDVSLFSVSERRENQFLNEGMSLTYVPDDGKSFTAGPVLAH